MLNIKNFLNESTASDQKIKTVTKACYQILGYFGIEYRSHNAYPISYGISFDGFSGRSTVIDDIKKLFDKHNIIYSESMSDAGWCDKLKISPKISNVTEIEKLGNKLWSQVKKTTLPLIKEYTELISQLDVTPLNSKHPHSNMVLLLPNILDENNKKFTSYNYWHDFQKDIDTIKEFLPVQNDIDKVNAKRKENLQKDIRSRNTHLSTLLDAEYERITGENPK